DGSKHNPSYALAVPSVATARSGASTSEEAKVPAMAMKKESGSDDVSVTSSPSASDPPAVLHDGVSDSLPVPSKVNPDPLTHVPSVTPSSVVAENAGTVSPVPSVAPSPAPQAALPQTVFVSIPRRRR
ncbi:hypothetical protein D917_10534, partial [Trichinella nativa]